MRNYFGIIFLLLFSANSVAQNSKAAPLDTTFLFQHWILNDKHNSGQLDHLSKLDLIPVSFGEFYDLPMHIKYAGISFEQNHLLVEHFWNKCGTGNPPDHLDAVWTFTKKDEKYFIAISGSQLWDGDYEIIELSENSLKLVRI